MLKISYFYFNILMLKTYITYFKFTLAIKNNNTLKVSTLLKFISEIRNKKIKQISKFKLISEKNHICVEKEFDIISIYIKYTNTKYVERRETGRNVTLTNGVSHFGRKKS